MNDQDELSKMSITGCFRPESTTNIDEERMSGPEATLSRLNREKSRREPNDVLSTSFRSYFAFPSDHVERLPMTEEVAIMECLNEENVSSRRQPHKLRDSIGPLSSSIRKLLSTITIESQHISSATASKLLPDDRYVEYSSRKQEKSAHEMRNAPNEKQYSIKVSNKSSNSTSRRRCSRKNSLEAWKDSPINWADSDDESLADELSHWKSWL